MELSKNQKKSQGCRNSLKDETQCSEGSLGSLGTSVLATLNEDSDTCLELGPSLSDGWKNSNTHTRRMEKIPDGQMSAENKDRPWSPTRCPHSRLENSASITGFGATRRLLHENPSENDRELIEYRNLTPQVPFVPCVAKSLPKKRIFFHKPKKSIKDLFVHKKHSCKKAASPSTPCREYGPKSKQTKKSSRCHDRARAGEKIDDFLSFSDSSSECCASVHEDSVSVQSFGSQAGCGEIFADEEFVVSLEGAANPKMYKDGGETPKRSPVASAFLGGNKQLASSGESEVLDLFTMWETVNLTIPTGQSLSQGAKATSTPMSSLPVYNKTISPSENLQDMSSEIKTPLLNKAASPLDDFAALNRTPKAKMPLSSKSASPLVDFTVPNNTVEAKTPSSNNTAIPLTWVTQKTENQESIIDEGYCDYISSEDHTGQSLTPVYSRKFPRDSYSGDALYELFFDPGEVETTPIFDDEMDLTHSVFGLPSPDLPLSMYSFHVGSEENLAPSLPLDLINHDFLQSNWVGKECLLKLCDTEISLTMGLVNWLKQRTLKGNKTEVASPGVSTDEQCQEDKIQSENLTNVPINLSQNTSCWIDADSLPEFNLKQQKRRVTTPESQPRTPTSHVCFQIFNINSTSTPSQALASPLGHSPSSRTSSMFVLAVNKESLCDSCKALLKNGAKKLHLCHSCIAFVEHIKSSDFWGCAKPNQAKIVESPRLLNVGVLPSPCSSYGIASDISLLSLVEQCANQMSSMKINQHRDLSTAAKPEKEERQKKKCTRKDVKSKSKTKGNLTGRGSLHHKVVQSPSVLEDKKHGLVTTKESRHLKTNPPNSNEVFQASRPTSLSLPNPTSSEFSKQEHHGNRKVKEKEHERRNKKAAVNMNGLSDHVVPVQKMERSRRMKK
ncbi:uncharacterized protein amer3 [Trichomycterus rosablanca]|uniref:uncharacterized protein amer3 n=1 Tax=Trichomycterus rosablanca TaxID=2290929 RepID=UPI002F351B64